MTRACSCKRIPTLPPVSLPRAAGAYTSICSSKHVPQFNERAPELMEQGVDLIACLSVNGDGS